MLHPRHHKISFFKRDYEERLRWIFEVHFQKVLNINFEPLEVKTTAY